MTFHEKTNHISTGYLCKIVTLGINSLFNTVKTMSLAGQTSSKSVGNLIHGQSSNRQLDGLKELLEASDYVCSILPSTPQTVGLLNGDVLKSCAQRVSEMTRVTVTAALMCGLFLV